jgi:beta-glucosidase
MVQVGGSSDNLQHKTGFTLSKAEGKPDLSVRNIRTMPAFPKEGDEVVFMASLINNGTAATNKGDSHIIRFYVDGKEVANYHSKSIAIPVGGMELACAQGLKGVNWKAANGNFKITAKIEVQETADLNQQNNACEAELQIPNGKVVPVEIARIFK